MKNISPFYFDLENSFIYNFKFYNDFKIFCKSFNDYKPSDDESFFLINNINYFVQSFSIFERKKNDFNIIQYFHKIFKKNK